MESNITYRTDELVRYFSQNRIRWAQFYESERVIIERLNPGPQQTILDIGCSCGGLGLALRERFGVTSYTGVEINQQSADAARAMNPTARIFHGDVLDLTRTELCDRQFDVVFSLSCVDWNVRFADMLAAAWQHVRPGGYFVATFRLTDGPGCTDIARSYQHINYEGERKGELAAYVVLNAHELMQVFAGLGPTSIDAFGYWREPSTSAITPYQRLCFCAIALGKRDCESGPTRMQLDLPEEIRNSMEQL